MNVKNEAYGKEVSNKDIGERLKGLGFEVLVDAK